MKRRPLWVYTLLALGLAFALLRACSPGDEHAIRGQLKHLARHCEKKPNQTIIRSALDANDVRAYFTTNATIHLGRAVPTSLRRADIPSLVARVHSAVESLSIAIQGIDFEPRSARDVRELRTAIEFMAKTGESTESYLDEYRIRFRKIDGSWLIESVNADSSIERPINF
ncbi:MAG: hypothetical protein M9963_04520 [Kiritimatiellae bacterium]|nr:hypothetical protein [Kiritimatiellia bacterium]MCO6400957.1 hypothetical protein [Verrucomicrobiota bacterium]